MAAFALAAADYPRLDHRVLFPLAAVQLIVMFEGGVIDHHGTRVAPRTQAQINPVDKAVGAGFAEHLGQRLDHAGIEFLMRQVAEPGQLAVAVETADQIDVGGKIEFAPPELAHCDDVQLHCLSVLVDGLSMLGGEKKMTGVQRGRNQLIGEIAEPRQALFDRSLLDHIQVNDFDHFAMPVTAQRGFHLIEVNPGIGVEVHDPGIE